MVRICHRALDDCGMVRTPRRNEEVMGFLNIYTFIVNRKKGEPREAFHTLPRIDQSPVFVMMFGKVHGKQLTSHYNYIYTNIDLSRIVWRLLFGSNERRSRIVHTNAEVEMPRGS